MSQRYRFTWALATLAVVLGFITIAAGVVGAVAIAAVIPASWFDYRPPGFDWKPSEPLPASVVTLRRGLWATYVGGAAFILGSGMVVVGQLLRVFLDQRTLLARIYARLRRWEARTGTAEQDRGPRSRLDRR